MIYATRTFPSIETTTLVWGTTANLPNNNNNNDNTYNNDISPKIMKLLSNWEKVVNLIGFGDIRMSLMCYTSALLMCYLPYLVPVRLWLLLLATLHLFWSIDSINMYLQISLEAFWHRVPDSEELFHRLDQI